MRLLVQVLDYQLQCSEIINTDAEDNGRQWLIPITDPIISTSLTTSVSSIRGTSMVQVDDNGRRIGSFVIHIDCQVQVSVIFIILEISWPSIAQVVDHTQIYLPHQQLMVHCFLVVEISGPST